MPYTTIQITTETKKKLDNLKEYRRETYNDVINRLIPLKTSPHKHRTHEHKRIREPLKTHIQTPKIQETSPYEETEY